MKTTLQRERQQKSVGFSNHFRKFQITRLVQTPRTALLLALSLWGAAAQAQAANTPTAPQYSYLEQGKQVDLVATPKYLVSVLDINLNSDQVSRNHLSKINSRISQQAEKSQLNYIKEINDPTKQISLWENNNLEKRVSSLFSKIYQRTTANNAVTSASSDYLIPTGGILIETEQEESSNLMTWIREQGRTIQKVTNDAFYWIDTELGEDAVSIAAEISKIKGIKTSKPSFKTVKLDQ